MEDGNSFSKEEISIKIHNLRLKLNRAYETQGHTEEVVEISQELDKYIALIQQQITERIKREIN